MPARELQRAEGGCRIAEPNAREPIANSLRSFVTYTSVGASVHMHPDVESIQI